MRVKVGWSGETSSNIWQKADVELGEDDLVRMLAEHDLSTGTLALKLPVPVVYELLASEAEQLLLKKLTTLGYPGSQAAERIDALRVSQDALMQAIVKKFAPLPA